MNTFKKFIKEEINIIDQTDTPLCDYTLDKMRTILTSEPFNYKWIANFNSPPIGKDVAGRDGDHPNKIIIAQRVLQPNVVSGDLHPERGYEKDRLENISVMNVNLCIYKHYSSAIPEKGSHFRRIQIRKDEIIVPQMFFKGIKLINQLYTYFVTDDLSSTGYYMKKFHEYVRQINKGIKPIFICQYVLGPIYYTLVQGTTCHFEMMPQDMNENEGYQHYNEFEKVTGINSTDRLLTYVWQKNLVKKEIVLKIRKALNIPLSPEQIKDEDYAWLI